VLKWVCTTDDSGARNEIVVPQTTVDATVEAVIAEGFSPVFAEVDSRSWLLSLESTQRSISDRTAAIITVDWLDTLCDLGPFRKLADEYNIKLISDSAQSFGASTGRPLSIDHAHAIIYSMGYPKVLTGAGSGGLIVCSKSVTKVLECDPSGILRHETISETGASMCLQALCLLPGNLETRSKAGQEYCSSSEIETKNHSSSTLL
jgi:dTDP-4-amino-4,6-dideoxygalactose transaminase